MFAQTKDVFQSYSTFPQLTNSNDYTVDHFVFQTATKSMKSVVLTIKIFTCELPWNQ